VALTDIHTGDAGNASQLQQFVDLLTGVMTDQLITLTGGLSLTQHVLNTVPVMRGTVPLGVQIWIQSTTPATPNDGDLWLQTP
jgi:hypothetical protein